MDIKLETKPELITLSEASRLVGESHKSTYKFWKDRCWTNHSTSQKLAFSREEVRLWRTCQVRNNKNTRKVRFVPWGFKGTSTALGIGQKSFEAYYLKWNVPFYSIPFGTNPKTWKKVFNPKELQEWATLNGHPLTPEDGYRAELKRDPGYDQEGPPEEAKE